VKIGIASPIYGGGETGSVSVRYHEAVLALIRGGAELVDSRILTDTDLVRARSRAVAVALDRGWDHLLFWDVDVIAPVSQIATCLRGMLATGHDVVAAPYAKKRIDWAGSYFEQRSEDAHANVTEYLRGDGEVLGAAVGDCVPVKYAPMGFTLLSSPCLRRMVDAIEHGSLRYRDQWASPGAPRSGWRDVTACFQLVIEPERRVLLEEGYSFCYRWRKLGGEVWLYDGPGSNLQHVGAHVYGPAACSTV
jgi:hypothetical protein